MGKITSWLYIGLGIFFILAAVLQLLAPSRIWNTGWILIGTGCILSGVTFYARGTHQKTMRRLTLGFAGGALVFLVIALVQSLSQH